MNTNKIILTAILVCFAGLASIQAQFRHEFGLSGGYGQSSLNYSLNNGLFDRNIHILKGYGGEGAFNYIFLFHPHWGVGIGAAVGVYNTTAVLSGNTITAYDQSMPPASDGVTLKYNLITTLNYYEEHQRLLAFNIPLFMQFEASGTHKFYARLGGKLSLPIVSPTYDVKDADFTHTASVIIPDNNIPNTDKLSYDGKLKFGVGVMLSAEAGVKWRLSNMLSLYTGAYFDYGVLADMHNTNKQPFVQVDNIALETPKFQYNSILHARNAGNGVELVDRVSPMAMGVVLRFTISTSQDRKVVLEENASPARQSKSKSKEQRSNPKYGDVPQQTRYHNAPATKSSKNKNTTAPYPAITPQPQPQQRASVPYPYYVGTAQQSTTSSAAPRLGQRIIVPINGNNSTELTLVRVYDSSGILVHEHFARGGAATVEIPYQRGTYLVQVGTVIKKVVVE